MTINSNTKLADILVEYPWLLDELVKVNDKFKMVKTPMGKIVLKKATVADMSRKSSMDETVLIEKLNEMIRSHEGK
ncbi:MAG: hypothetical protein IJV48_01335 [Ruminococcus sp.]|nr:hypothetical protein [Ruminococcus sp.]